MKCPDGGAPVILNDTACLSAQNAQNQPAALHVENHDQAEAGLLAQVTNINSQHELSGYDYNQW